MVNPAQHGRPWTARRQPLLVSLLVVAVLLPVAVLFVGYWQDIGDRRAVTEQERNGVEYLAALGGLTVALTDAQSAAVTGGPVAHEALDRAVESVDAVDERLGERLRVRDRWSQLRARIEQVSGVEYPDPRAAFTAYSETTGLLLGLHNKLRETSGLIRDPDADAYHLQDAAAEELPEAMVTGSRLVDLVAMAATGTAEPPVSAAEVSVARAAFTSPVEDLTTGLQAALDSTESRTLSGSVLSTFDRFLREKDALLALLPADGDAAESPLEPVIAVRGQLQAAGTDLLSAMYQEIDTLVAARGDRLRNSQWLALVTTVVAVLLVAAAVAALWLGDRWPRRRRSHRSLVGPGYPDGVSTDGYPGGEHYPTAGGPGGAPEPAGYPGSRPAVGAPSGWERSGAR